MRRIANLPADDTGNGWSAILPPRAERPPLAGDVRADWVVVGAGYAGLAAARRLAENRPGDHVVLVEAEEAGEGASGRNSGFAIDVPHNVGSALAELEASHRHLRLSRAAIDHLEALITAHGIDCHWSRRGKYHAAVSEKGVCEVLEPMAKELAALGEPCRWIEGKALAAEIGTPYYTAALYTPGGALLNPAALCRGLADCLPGNVTLHERTPVTALEVSDGVVLTTPGGSVSAPRMILTVNAWAEQFGAFRGRLLPFAAHASLTRRLTAAERQALGGAEDWGLTPANAFAGITMRFTRDHRILIRQNLHYCPSLRQDARDRARNRRHHQQLFHGRFPMLPQVTLEHTWTGYVCLSRNHAPGFGRIAPNVWSAVCQNAIGVTKGTIGGVLAADQACGVDNPLIADMESLGTPSPLPPRPFLDLGVRARMVWELWRTSAEK